MTDRNITRGSGQYSSSVPAALGLGGTALPAARAWANDILDLLGQAEPQPIKNQYGVTVGKTAAQTAAPVQKALSGLSDQLQALLDGLDGLSTAMTDIANISNDVMSSNLAKRQRYPGIISAASSTCDRALTAFSAALDAASTGIQRTLLPQRPAGVSDTILVAQAERLERLLPQDAETLMTVVPQLITQAIEEGDMLTAYLLAGADSPLQLVYKSIDFSRTARGAAGYSQAVVSAVAASGSQASADPITGQVIHAVCDGGENTLKGFLTVARTALYEWNKSMAGWLAMVNQYA